MRKIFILFVILAITASVLVTCRTAPTPEPLPVEEPLPEPYVEAYVPEPELPKEELPPFESNEFERLLFEIINIERRFNRLPPLTWHDGASFVSREHSIDMFNNDLMRHTGSNGSTIRDRLERACLKNMRRWSANIGGGYLTPEAVFEAWMESPIYRPNILSREFTHIGVGFFERPAGSNARYATYWTVKLFSLDS